MSKNNKLNKLDYSAMKVPELKKELVFLKKSLMNLRFQKATGELSNTSEINKIRKNQARVLTQLNKINKK